MTRIAVNCEATRVGGTRSHLVAVLEGAQELSGPNLYVPLARGEEPGTFSLERVSGSVATPLPLRDRLRWERQELPAALEQVDAGVLLQPSNVPLLASIPQPQVQVLHNIAPLVRPLRRVARGRLLGRLIVLRGLTAAGLRRAAGMVFLSETAFDIVRRRGWHGRGALIRPGISSAAGRVTRQPTIVVVAHLFRYKRVEDAIAGFLRSGLAADGYGLDVYGGPYDRRYAAELQRLAGHRPGIRLLGARPPADVRAAITTAAAVIQPSACENAPQVVYEAIGARTPLVASDIGAHRELLAHGLYPVGDIDALAAALRAAIQTGAAPATRVALNSWAEVAEELADFCAGVA